MTEPETGHAAAYAAPPRRSPTRPKIFWNEADELMRTVIKLDLDPENVASVIFTTTPDLTATFRRWPPAKSAGPKCPSLCGHEMAVPGSLQKCVRVMIHANATRTAAGDQARLPQGRARNYRPEWAYCDSDVSRC